MRITLFLSTVLLSSVLSAQSKKDVKTYKIKSVTENVTSYEGGKETTWKSEYRTFDKNGNTTEHSQFNPDGTVKQKELKKFNAKGEVIEEIVVEGKNAGKSADEEDAGKYKHALYKYNSDGDETEDLRYDEKGNVIKMTVTVYNAKGDKISETTNDASGKTIRKITYAYDSKGLKTERNVYGPGDKLLKKHKYTYSY